jgi:hypothetical protein
MIELGVVRMMWPARELADRNIGTLDGTALLIVTGAHDSEIQPLGAAA